MKGGGVETEPTAYLAVVKLSWRDAKGKRIVLPAGESSGRIPPESVPWLLASGLIEEVRA
jgi:hypothetical protein